MDLIAIRVSFDKLCLILPENVSIQHLNQIESNNLAMKNGNPRFRSVCVWSYFIRSEREIKSDSCNHKIIRGQLVTFVRLPHYSGPPPSKIFYSPSTLLHKFVDTLKYLLVYGCIIRKIALKHIGISDKIYRFGSYTYIMVYDCNHLWSCAPFDS